MKELKKFILTLSNLLFLTTSLIHEGLFPENKLDLIFQPLEMLKIENTYAFPSLILSVFDNYFTLLPSGQVPRENNLHLQKRIVICRNL